MSSVRQVDSRDVTILELGASVEHSFDASVRHALAFPGEGEIGRAMH